MNASVMGSSSGGRRAILIVEAEPDPGHGYVAGANSR